MDSRHPILVQFNSYQIIRLRELNLLPEWVTDMTFTDVVKTASHFQKFSRPNLNHSFYFDKQERLCETYCYGFARITAEDIAANDWSLEEVNENYITTDTEYRDQLAS